MKSPGGWVGGRGGGGGAAGRGGAGGGAGVTAGQEGTAVIRVERVRLGDNLDGNQLELPLLTSMYLGDRWEYLFRTVADDFVIRAYGPEVRGKESCHLSLPTEHLWIFPKL